MNKKIIWDRVVVFIAMYLHCVFAWWFSGVILSLEKISSIDRAVSLANHFMLALLLIWIGHAAIFVIHRAWTRRKRVGGTVQA